MMLTRLMTASALTLGLLASSAFAANDSNYYCGKGASYDSETLRCVTDLGAEVNDTAGFAVGASAPQVDTGSVGDFIDETVTQRNERSGI
jgi:hypothetical protein